ncbi:GntR family transcriptional regulator [Reyranella soli]|uniref:GntR family transcriptional regulator n=2 Tax=Reyranella soli TaxID=1230389 RepID=A0A512NF00_9HYPH|nr:GntR family transcriptional regulator [Reyranella soli]
MPSTRGLAQELGVSRITVALAYDQLASEGYMEARRGSGMYVCSTLPDDVLKVTKEDRSRKRLRPFLASDEGVEPRFEPRAHRPFQVGALDPELFPHATWSRLLARAWRNPVPALTGAPDSFGWRPLRNAIARHLAEWRDIDCDSAQIVVTSGTADALDIIGRCVFARGDTVLVEDPGYAPMRFGLEKNGIGVLPVRVDDEGFDLDAVGPRLKAKGAVLTPSRQFPLGATLTLTRRLKLLDWVARTGGYLIEDDFDSEYRYRGAPLPALMSLDRHERVIYLGSFSKILSPTLRIGFMVLPALFLDEVRAYLRLRGVAASLVAQPALAEFMLSGDLAVHIRRTRRLYAQRQEALVSSASVLDGLLEIVPSTAGMHLVADLVPRLRKQMTDRAATRLAAEAGVVVRPLADFFAGQPDRSALLLGFAGFGEDELRRSVRVLAETLRRGS